MRKGETEKKIRGYETKVSLENTYWERVIQNCVTGSPP